MAKKNIRPNNYAYPKNALCLLKILKKGAITIQSGLSSRFILTSHMFFLLGSPEML